MLEIHICTDCYFNLSTKIKNQKFIPLIVRWFIIIYLKDAEVKDCKEAEQTAAICPTERLLETAPHCILCIHQNNYSTGLQFVHVLSV